jgi:hypothetical protein
VWCKFGHVTPSNAAPTKPSNSTVCVGRSEELFPDGFDLSFLRRSTHAIVSYVNRGFRGWGYHALAGFGVRGLKLAPARAACPT